MLSSFIISSKPTFMSILRILVTMTFAIIFFSCKKDTPLQEPLIDTLRSGGSWTINDFENEFVLGIDSSMKYIGNSLVFHTDGKMLIQNSIASGNGLWKAYNAANSVFLSISIDADDFLYIEGAWGLVTVTATQIKLSRGYWFPEIMTIVKN